MKVTKAVVTAAKAAQRSLPFATASGLRWQRKKREGCGQPVASLLERLLGRRGLGLEVVSSVNDATGIRANSS